MTNVKEAEKPQTIPAFFMSDMMKLLSELETIVWDNRERPDKVRMQNIIIVMKSNLIQIDKDNRDIISVYGLRYKRVFE